VAEQAIDWSFFSMARRDARARVRLPIVRQCAGLQAGGEGGRTVSPSGGPVLLLDGYNDP
jgi:hypothetical protein